MFSATLSFQSITVNTVSSSDAGWLSGWTYRKAHNIAGSTAGELFNYPILLNVHFNNGADIGEQVYLAGKCRTDFGDIRFTDETGSSELNYWIQQKTDSVQALIWVKISSVPASPAITTIYVYYGNETATTTCNKDWTLSLMSDFEDGTEQGWFVSWSNPTSDGVSSDAYHGNYSRMGGRMYGSWYAGTGVFNDGFMYSIYLPTGSYHFEAYAQTDQQNSYFTPLATSLLADGYAVDNVTSPGTSWQKLSGNFTVSASATIQLDVVFRISVSGELWNGADGYRIDDLLVRPWCNPEPTNSQWGAEQTSPDVSAPQIFIVGWIPTSPYPLVPSSVPRQGEPVSVMANVSDESGGSGLDSVVLHYRINDGEWANVSMVFREDTWWSTTMPGQLGNSTLEFYVTATDNAGNSSTTGIDSYVVVPFLLGDINGDGIVNMWDIGTTARHFMEHTP
jgi:hypothetical protein